MMTERLTNEWKAGVEESGRWDEPDPVLMVS